MNVVVLKDINGKFVTVEMDEFAKSMVESKFKIFDMDLSCIQALYNEYRNRGGALPVTIERIQKIFYEKENANA